MMGIIGRIGNIGNCSQNSQNYQNSQPLPIADSSLFVNYLCSLMKLLYKKALTLSSFSMGAVCDTGFFVCDRYMILYYLIMI